MILRFASFLGVVEQLRSWQATRIRDRQHALANALLGHRSEPPRAVQRGTDGRRQKPDWFDQMPDSCRGLLSEVYAALSQDLRALASMGVRAVIDTVSVDMVGDLASFELKLSALKDKGHISETERSILAAAIDAGSASAHRGYVPTREDLGTLLDILEHLLRAHYILPRAAEKLKLSTPPRKPRQGNS